MASAYGLLSKLDIATLHACLVEIAESLPANEPVSILEIGVWNGCTARGMREFLKTIRREIKYTGIESGVGAEAVVKPPFDGARVIIADSVAARRVINDQDRLNLLIIDGCHCLTHACMDFLCYQSLVLPGGFALFHDINPAFQGVEQHHASNDHASMPMRVAVLQAIHLLGLVDNRFPGWMGRLSKWEPGCSNGYFVAKKLRH